MNLDSYKHIKLQPRLKGKQLVAYLKKHAQLIQSDGGTFWRVTTPLLCFKKVWLNNQQIIANLTLPIGADIYTSKNFENTANHKLRASQAYVHSLATRDGKNVSLAYSSYRKKLPYRPDTIVKPDSFSLDFKGCTNGIHFFLNVQDAYWYM